MKDRAAPLGRADPSGRASQAQTQAHKKCPKGYRFA